MRKRLVSVALCFALMLLLGATTWNGCGSDSVPGSNYEPSRLPDVSGFKAAHEWLPVEVKLDRLVYAAGDFIRVDLIDPTNVIASEEVQIAVVAPESQDVEVVTLARDAVQRLRSDGTLALSTSGQGSVQDGVLQAAPGEIIYALYFVDVSQPAQAALAAQILADFAFVKQANANVEAMILPELALSDDEKDPSIARPAGTLLMPGSVPVQIARGELIVFTRSDAELQAFLEQSGATLLDSSPDDGGLYTAHLVKADLSAAHPEQIEQYLDLFGVDGEVHASNSETLATLSLALEYQLDGYLVAVNPRLQTAGAPAASPTEEGNNETNMKLQGAKNIPGSCIPNDPARPCVMNVPAVWAFQSLFDNDEQTINVAVLDMGFAVSGDFRRPTGGSFVECDMTSTPPDCGPGKAEAPPTVGNSFFGDKSWHGTGVVSTLSAKVNNGYGTSGVAGQIAVPMMYKYDTAAYAFDIGKGIRRAVDDGASLINISAGYPCKLLLVGPDYDICSESGRDSLCAALTAGVAAAAAATCASVAWIPIAGEIVCAAAFEAVNTAIAACIAQVKFGELMSPIQSGVEYAASKGVPVVTIAGNRINQDDLPPIIRNLVDLSDQRTDSWKIIPAMIPETIVVGATDTDLNNTHFYGNRVDLWAPTPTAYMAPQSINDINSTRTKTTISATSAAAPYVAGVIANMMAANPQLNPRNPALTFAQKGSIVDSIKEILTSDEATWSNDELVALGFDDEPVERRKLVNPLAAVQLAAQGIVPDLAALGYDTSMGFSEQNNTDDIFGQARQIAFGQTMTGTIVSLTAEDQAPQLEDVDYYTFHVPASPPRPQEALVTLTYPSGFDGLYIDYPAVWMPQVGPQSGPETIKKFMLLVNAGSDIIFAVRGSDGRDNVYKVQVSAPVPVTPEVKILEPQAGSEICANRQFSASAHAWYSHYFSQDVPSNAVEWSAEGQVLGVGQSALLTLPAGTHELTASAWGDPNASDSVTVEARECVGSPPVVSITTPAEDLVGSNSIGYDGYDNAVGKWYSDVLLEGVAVDVEDGSLPDDKIVWKTDRTDIQPALLGTGHSLTVRLYSNDYCGGATHTITMQATDSAGNPSPTDSRRITLFIVCK